MVIAADCLHKCSDESWIFATTREFDAATHIHPVRGKRAKGTCDETSKQTAQTGADTLAQYYCLYRGARLTYSATFIPDPVAPK